MAIDTRGSGSAMASDEGKPPAKAATGGATPPEEVQFDTAVTVMELLQVNLLPVLASFSSP